MSEQTHVDVDATNPQQEETVVTEHTEQKPIESEIDYKTKFSESSREALRLLEEKRKVEAELEALRSQKEDTSYGNETDQPLYVGFETLPEDEQQRLVEYTKSIERKVSENLYKDPVYASARLAYNESRWNSAFEEAKAKYPELESERTVLKEKYFNKDHIPENMPQIMEDIAKIHLFDKAKEIGAKQATEQAERIDIERSTGGDKTPPTSRSLEDWHDLAQSNPAEFARRASEYNADMQSGKLK